MIRFIDTLKVRYPRQVAEQDSIYYSYQALKAENTRRARIDSENTRYHTCIKRAGDRAEKEYKRRDRAEVDAAFGDCM